MAQISFRRIVALTLIVAAMTIGIVQIGFSYKDVGFTFEPGVALVKYDFSSVPQLVADDASRISRELFGTGDKYREFADQLMATYLQARDKDFILVFNPGGWGTTSRGDAPGWESILNGIRSELDIAGYRSIALDYQRTTASARGRWTEFVEILSGYPSKSRGLAQRVEFLTDNIPQARIIMAGESNGTVISDYAMSLLKNNERVYSILTGTPFWHQPLTEERTLRLNNNGIRPDSLNRGQH